MPSDAELEDDDPSSTATPHVNDMNQISQCSAPASSDLPTMVVMNSLTPLNLESTGETTTPSADCSSSSSTKGFPQNYTDCSVCGLHLHKRRLYEHMRETHDNTGLKYKCPCCYKLYISPIALRTHVIRSPQCSAFNSVDAYEILWCEMRKVTTNPVFSEPYWLKIHSDSKRLLNGSAVTKRYGSLASYQTKPSPTSRDAVVDVPKSLTPESSCQSVLAPPVATSSAVSEDVRRRVSQHVVRSSASNGGGGSRTSDNSLFRCQLCSEAFTTPQGCKVHIFRRHGVKAHTLSSV
uniref:C2H2-type domain-containing protein n=1 Tax=Romanomermis culicivorax TaxID=13658 RepID=A0A915L822_ROMCU